MQRFEVTSKNGTLEVPAETFVFHGTDEMLAYDYVIKKSTRLYAGPTTIGNSECIVADVVEGQRVFARPVPGYKHILEVVTYTEEKNQRDGMAETGLSIKAGHRGYILKSEAKKASGVNEHFKQMNARAIFPNDNLINDIKQYRLGDCFLLASLISILKSKHGDELIKGMIKLEEGGKTAIVRLFHPDTFEPIYIRVSTTEYRRNHEEVNGHRTMITHGAPWVHLIEKAYVAFAMKKAEECDPRALSEHTVLSPSFHHVFGNGGSTQTALQILTGKKAEDKNLTKVEWPLEADMLMVFFSKAQTFSNIVNEAGDACDQIDQFVIACDKGYLDRLAESLFRLNSTDDNFFDKLKSLELPWVSINSIKAKINEGKLTNEDLHYYLVTLVNTLRGEDRTYHYMGGLANVVRVGLHVDAMKVKDLSFESIPFDIEHLSERLQKIKECLKGSDEEKRAAIEQLKKLLFPHGNAIVDLNAGFGKYSARSERVYAGIEAALNKGDVVTFSTQDSIDAAAVEGMYGNHAYGVVGVRVETTGLTSGTKYVRLRNPWGHTGHTGVWDSQKQEFVGRQVAEGEFELELSTLMRVMHRYTVGDVSRLRQIEDSKLNSAWDHLANERARLQSEKAKFESERAEFESERAEFERRKAEEADRLARVQRAPAEPAQQNMFRPYLGGIIFTTLVSATVFGAVGFALGGIFAPVTLGMSVPVGLGLGTLFGVCTGAVIGATASMMGVPLIDKAWNWFSNRRHRQAGYRRVPAGDSQTSLSTSHTLLAIGAGSPSAPDILSTSYSDPTKKDKGPADGYSRGVVSESMPVVAGSPASAASSSPSTSTPSSLASSRDSFFSASQIDVSDVNDDISSFTLDDDPVVTILSDTDLERRFEQK